MALRMPVSTDNAPAAIGPYSQAIRTGSLLFCSGQVPLDPSSGELVKEDVEGQARRCLENLSAVCEAALSQAVRCTVYLTDMGDFARERGARSSSARRTGGAVAVGVPRCRRARTSRSTRSSRSGHARPRRVDLALVSALDEDAQPLERIVDVDEARVQRWCRPSRIERARKSGITWARSMRTRQIGQASSWRTLTWPPRRAASRGLPSSKPSGASQASCSSRR